MKSLGVAIILAGAVLILVGLGLVLAGKVPFLGHLPGDISLRGRNWFFSFPLVSCIGISVILTLILNLLFRLLHK